MDSPGDVAGHRQQGAGHPLPVYLIDLTRRIRRAAGQLELELGRQPTIDDIARALGLSGDKISEVLSVPAEPLSLQTPVGEDQDAELGDLIAAARSSDPGELLAADDPRPQEGMIWLGKIVRQSGISAGGFHN